MSEKLPTIIQASTGIFGAVAAPLGNIDKLVVIDQGGNSSADTGSTGLARLAKTGPTVVFNLLQQLEALGLDLPAIMQQLGVNQKNGGREVATTPPPAETEAPSKTSKTKS